MIIAIVVTVFLVSGKLFTHTFLLTTQNQSDKLIFNNDLIQLYSSATAGDYTNIHYNNRPKLLTSSILWSYTTGDDVYSSPSLGDLDGDDKLEVVVGSWDDNVYALNGEDGSVLWSCRTGRWVTYSSPSLGDLDGDGKVEVVIGSYDNNIYAFDFPSAGSHVYWQGHGGTESFKRTRNIETIDPDHDGLSTTFEKMIGTNPYQFNNDTDGDGMVNEWEQLYGLDPNDDADSGNDFDGDGLSNIQEYSLALNASNNDTDSDGLTDSYEYNHNINPRVSDTDHGEK